MSIHRYIGCLHEIEIQFFKKYGLIGRQNRLESNTWYCLTGHTLSALQ